MVRSTEKNLVSERRTVHDVVGLAVADGPLGRKDVGYGNHELITSLVRDAILQAGLGQKNPEVPLADIIQPGMTVLLKPNWVLHYNRGAYGMDCMVTQPEFILATLKEVIAADPRRVILGDAPIQGCKWEGLVTDDFRENVDGIVKSIALELVDFRRTIFSGATLADGVEKGVRGRGSYVLFDLGSESLLEPVSSHKGRFRVTMYNPNRLSETHQPGKHQYLLCREVFEADVIINLPKLKTHSKAGLTGALKNIVGLVGDKDYLPHYRLGGTCWGGDCYPGLAPLKRAAEFFLDKANRKIGSVTHQLWKNWANRILFLQTVIGDQEIEGGWYGNDTVWRMVLDLNRILIYGRPDGTMAEVPQRRIWSLTDAIVCGQGDGPLAAKPLHLGAVTFSSSSVAADQTHAALFRFDNDRIPLLREAHRQFRWPLNAARSVTEIRYGNRTISLTQAARELGVGAEPSRGWIGHCEMSLGGPPAV